MFLSKNWLILYLDYKHAISPNFFHQIILIVFWYPGHPHGSFYTQLFKNQIYLILLKNFRHNFGTKTYQSRTFFQSELENNQ